jgi:hypothetical protein
MLPGLQSLLPVVEDAKDMLDLLAGADGIRKPRGEASKDVAEFCKQYNCYMLDMPAAFKQQLADVRLKAENQFNDTLALLPSQVGTVNRDLIAWGV